MVLDARPPARALRTRLKVLLRKTGPSGGSRPSRPGFSTWVARSVPSCVKMSQSIHCISGKSTGGKDVVSTLIF